MVEQRAETRAAPMAAHSVVPKALQLVALMVALSVVEKVAQRAAL